MKRKALKIGLGVICVIMFFLIPDLIDIIRNLISSVPLIKKITSNNISPQDYIQMMITALFNCFAIIVSVMAYNIAKKPYVTQVEQRNQEIFEAAINIQFNIKTNCKIIYDLKQDKGNANILQINKDLLGYAICLLVSEKITYEQFKYIHEYINEITKFSTMIKNLDGEKRTKEIDSIYRKYFNNGTFEYCDMLKSVTDSLEEIGKGDKDV